MKRSFLFATLFLLCGAFFLEAAYAVRYTGDGFRDPFGKPTPPQRSQDMAEEEPEAFAEFVLDGIIWVPEKPRAIINGRRVIEGAQIDGAKVLEIRRKEVTILFNGQEMILKYNRRRKGETR